MKKIALSAIAALLLMSGYAVADSSTPTKASVEKAISIAEGRYEDAKKAHIAWRNTKADLDKAKKLLTEGKLQEAYDLAVDAKYQSDTAFVESKEAADTWQLAVPK